MITKFESFKTEIKHDGILIIVDVQKEFSKFIQSNLVEELMKYAKTFDNVYQIWDSNKATAPSYNFPQEDDKIVKKFGVNFSKDLKQIIKSINNKYPNAQEGEKFKLEETDAYVVRVNNNHGWFYVPIEMADLFESLNGKKVVVVGGGENECLKDVFIALKSFGAKPVYNKKYIYSSKTNNQQKI